MRGRNGGLSLECRWGGFWGIGVKVVSLRSTLSTFWGVSVVLGDLVGLVCLYICKAGLRDSLGFEVIFNFLHLF